MDFGWADVQIGLVVNMDGQVGTGQVIFTTLAIQTPERTAKLTRGTYEGEWWTRRGGAWGPKYWMLKTHKTPPPTILRIRHLHSRVKLEVMLWTIPGICQFFGHHCTIQVSKRGTKNGVNSRQNSPKWQNRPKFSVFYAKKGPVVAVVTVVTNISFVLNLSLL